MFLGLRSVHMFMHLPNECALGIKISFHDALLSCA